VQAARESRRARFFAREHYSHYTNEFDYIRTKHGPVALVWSELPQDNWIDVPAPTKKLRVFAKAQTPAWLKGYASLAHHAGV
jgi:hypothetical protein